MNILKTLFTKSDREEKGLSQSIKSIILVGLIGTLVLLPSFANGFVFSTPIIISTSSYSYSATVVGDNQDNIYVIWADSTIPNVRNIFFSYSSDRGQSFSYPMNISNQTSGEPNYYGIATDGQGNVYIIWGELYYDIYFSRSTDGGQSFTTINVTNSQAQITNADLALDNQGNIYLAWNDYNRTLGRWEIFFCRSTDFGSSFSTPISLIPSSHGGSHTGPQIAVDNEGKISIIWGSQGEILFCYSEDGINFSQIINVSNTPNISTCYSPRPPKFRQLKVDDMGNIYIIWTECTSGNCSNIEDYIYYEIFFSYSEDGINFSPPVNVSNDSNQSHNLNLAVDGQGNINIFWQTKIVIDGVINTNILFSRSTDKGLSFSAPLMIAADTGNGRRAITPIPAVDGQGNISIIWNEKLISNNSWDIFFSHSTDGINFSTPLNLSNNPQNVQGSAGPSLFVSSQGDIYSAWHTRAGYVWDVFFCKKLTPEEQIDDLISQVYDLLGNGNPLTGILTGAKSSLTGGHNPGTCIMLQMAFIPQVEILIRRGELSEEEGQALIDAANEIINELCG